MHSIRLKNPTVQPIWRHTPQAMKLWICCLFAADPDGIIRVVPSILADIAKLSADEFAAAMADLLAVDKDNGGEAHLERWEYGVRVVRYDYWTEDQWKERRLRRNREAVARSRAKAKAAKAAKAAP